MNTENTERRQTLDRVEVEEKRCKNQVTMSDGTMMCSLEGDECLGLDECDCSDVDWKQTEWKNKMKTSHIEYVLSSIKEAKLVLLEEKASRATVYALLQNAEHHLEEYNRSE